MSIASKLLIGVALLGVTPSIAQAPPGLERIVVGVDAKFAGIVRKGEEARPAPNDFLAVLNVSGGEARLGKLVPGLDHSIQGPPQSVAITPDGKYGFVSAPTSFDFSTKKEVPEPILQRVRLSDGQVTVIDLGAHPNGLAINREGTLLLAACTDGSVKVLSIAGDQAGVTNTIKITDKRLSGIAITPDGRSALVAHRDEGGLSVLDIAGGEVTLSPERVTTGIGPLAIAMSGDGVHAVVGNIGMTTLIGVRGQLVGDSDSVTLINVSRRPFRAVQHVTVPSAPEGVAISRDGRFVAVQALDGSHLPSSIPGHHDRGQVLLFQVSGDKLNFVNSVPGGSIAQGLAFTTDGRSLLVDFNVEKQIAVYKVRNGRLVDSGQRIPLPGSAVSIATTPR